MIPNDKKIIISCSSSGSLVSFRGKLIEELVKKHQVYVFTPKITDENLKNKLNKLGVIIRENNLLRNRISVFGDVQYIFQLHRVIKDIKPDVFFSYTFKPIIFGSLVASIYGVNKIIAMLTGLGYSFSDGARKSAIGKVVHKLLRYSLNSSKRVKVIFQNKDDYKELLDTKIIDEKSQAFIVNGSGVDLSNYPYSEPDINNIQFLMMSRLINAKGVREYYEASSIIKEKYPHIIFKLIGNYDEGVDGISVDLYEKIKSNKIVEYSGWVDDVRAFIQNSSVVVLPSYREGLPRSVQEGMAMGRAIITTNTSGCRETVNPDVKKANGFLVPVKNVSELVAKMEYYINNPQEILRHGYNGRKFAEDRFDVNKVNKEMLEILEAD